jgi:hypothetical protein
MDFRQIHHWQNKEEEREEKSMAAASSISRVSKLAVVKDHSSRLLVEW